MAKEGQAISLNETQHQEFLSYLGDTRHSIRDTAIYLLTYRAGLRIGTVAGLRLSDVFDTSGNLKQVIILRKSIIKNNKTISGFLTHPELRDALEKYYKYRGKTKNDSLFITQKGTSFSANSLCQVMLKHYRGAGFEEGSSHSGRRSFASNMIKTGIDIVALSKIMGHSSISTTQRYIDHNMEDLKKFVAMT